MKPNENLEEKIKSIKDRIAECRDYISSDFCMRCTETYKEIARLEQELKGLVQDAPND